MSSMREFSSQNCNIHCQLFFAKQDVEIIMQTCTLKIEILWITHVTFINNMIGNIISAGYYWRPVKFLFKCEQFFVGYVDYCSDRSTPIF